MSKLNWIKENQNKLTKEDIIILKKAQNICVTKGGVASITINELLRPENVYSQKIFTLK